MDAPVTDADVIEQARHRAAAGLPPEGITIEAADEATMRRTLYAVFLDDAEHAA
ncbi:hypothetical protein [Nocardiopsis sp. NRRL B-16309]|uniref:hypothetical protein n=1 Tax=Nocardiopsis sp. NRRL B-16309 TaxID=1519494 RepID=UPI000A472482|nr:hypothetical protein [Nocardiopsis sp. NRRL B-16309]